MTVTTSFFNWQYSGLDPFKAPYEDKSPNLVALDDYLLDRWGGQVVGGHRNRDIGGSGRWSSHAYGAASDWRYEDTTNGNRAPGRAVLLAEIIPWLIEWSAELGIDAIHDYVGSRIWRAGRTSSTDPNDWWKHSDGSAMGEAWAQWLHIETHRDTFMDATPIDQRLTHPPIPKDDDIMLRAAKRKANGSWWLGDGETRWWQTGGHEADLRIASGAVDAKTAQVVYAWDEVQYVDDPFLNRYVGSKVVV